MKFNLKNKITKFLENFDLDKLFINSGNVFIRRILGLGISFLWVFTITNFFGSETYGLVTLSQMVISFGGMIFSLGVDRAIIKLGSTHKHYNNGVIRSGFLKKSLFIIFISSLICSFLLYFYKTPIALIVFKNKEFADYLLIISYFFFLFVIHKTTVGFLTVEDKFIKYGNFYFFFPNVCILIFVLIIYQLGLPDFYIIFGYLISYGIFGLILFFSLIKIPTTFKEKISYTSILKLSTPMMVSSSFLFIAGWTDTFMLGAMVSKSELGVYNVAFKLASLALIVIGAVNTVLAPKISKLYSESQIEQIKSEVQKATKIITYIALPLVVFLIVFRKPILGLFGTEFVSGEIALIIISIGMLFNAMSGSVAQILNMTKHQKEFRNFTLISALINIILNYFLIIRYGIEGAAIASLISNVVLNSLGIMYVKKKFGFYSFFKLGYK